MFEWWGELAEITTDKVCLCDICDKVLVSLTPKGTGTCAHCKFHNSWSEYSCDHCSKSLWRRRTHVQWRLASNSNRAVKKQPLYTGERAFCNKVCQGRWLGEEHGYGKQAHETLRDPDPERAVNNQENED